MKVIIDHLLEEDHMRVLLVAFTTVCWKLKTVKIVDVWDPESGTEYLFTYRLRTICLLLTFCLVPFCFHLPLPAVSTHSALTSVPDHLFLLLYPSALIPAFLHLSSPLIPHYLTHSSFPLHPFFFPGSHQCPLVPSATNGHSRQATATFCCLA